jgi:hypothetical protein
LNPSLYKVLWFLLNQDSVIIGLTYPGCEQPEERGIVLRDILEDQVGSEHYVGDNMQKNYKGGNQLNPNYKSQANTIHNEDKKSGTICAGTHGYANGLCG